MTKTTGEGTASLSKALDVLDAIAACPEGLNQADLADRLAVPRTTLYRLLSALGARGLVRRDPQRRVYRLGFRCFELARQAYAMPDLIAAASVEMRALRDLTGETSYLAVLDGLEVLSLERCDGAHSKRSSAALGQRKPLHCTSQGKAILSALDDDTRDAILKDLTLQPLTPRTITDRRRFLAELKITATRGYAVDDEEIVLGVRCVGAPIVDGAGVVRGAISVAGPAYRLSRERLELLGPELADAARRVGAQLAFAKTTSPGAPQPVDGSWAFHGAFPQWCAKRGRLYWADTLAPAVRYFDGVNDKELAALDTPVKSMVLCRSGLLAVCEDGVWKINADSGEKHAHACEVTLPQAMCVDAHGDVWASSAAADGRWRVGQWSPDTGMLAHWHPGEPISALIWSVAQTELYAIAPGSGSILIMRPGEDKVRRLTSISRGSGVPSGIAVDPAGGVWTAMSDGWNVMRFSADGNLDLVVGLSVPQPTDLAFGGEDRTTLFITTSRHALSLDTLNSAPQSGNLFRFQADFGTASVKKRS